MPYQSYPAPFIYSALKKNNLPSPLMSTFMKKKKKHQHFCLTFSFFTHIILISTFSATGDHWEYAMRAQKSDQKYSQSWCITVCLTPLSSSPSSLHPPSIPLPHPRVVFVQQHCSPQCSSHTHTFSSPPPSLPFQSHVKVTQCSYPIPTGFKKDFTLTSHKNGKS